MPEERKKIEAMVELAIARERIRCMELGKKTAALLAGMNDPGVDCLMRDLIKAIGGGDGEEGT
ncbi:MAG: hypothetical protein EHM36_06625 [Deltaproteobacteria bacterium]|nr:MAG: hypothetical protein EHM36_06625 [Deltaproteobacteria bacterium]